MALIRVGGGASAGTLSFNNIGHDIENPVTVTNGSTYVISGNNLSGTAITVTGGDIVMNDVVGTGTTEYLHTLVVKATSTSLTMTGLTKMTVTEVSIV